MTPETKFLELILEQVKNLKTAIVCRLEEIETLHCPHCNGTGTVLSLHGTDEEREVPCPDCKDVEDETPGDR
jgi:phage FluMu protein Com